MKKNKIEDMLNLYSLSTNLNLRRLSPWSSKGLVMLSGILSKYLYSNSSTE